MNRQMQQSYGKLWEINQINLVSQVNVILNELIFDLNVFQNICSQGNLKTTVHILTI